MDNEHRSNTDHHRVNISRKRYLKLAVVSLMLIVVIGFFLTTDTHDLSLERLQQQHNWLLQQYQAQPGLFALVFFLVYVAITAFSLPAAALLTLLSGAIFGLAYGLLLASFASSIGATFAFLMARFVLGQSLHQRFAQQLPKIHQGFSNEGAFYLFALRLVPVFPFFMINLVMGLLPIRTWTFYWVSQMGMLAGTAVYVFAGTELAKIQQLSDIASPSLLLALSLLGIFPLISKKTLQYWRQKKEGNHGL